MRNALPARKKKETSTEELAKRWKEEAKKIREDGRESIGRNLELLEHSFWKQREIIREVECSEANVADPLKPFIKSHAALVGRGGREEALTEMQNFIATHRKTEYRLPDGLDDDKQAEKITTDYYITQLEVAKKRLNSLQTKLDQIDKAKSEEEKSILSTSFAEYARSTIPLMYHLKAFQKSGLTNDDINHAYGRTLNADDFEQYDSILKHALLIRRRENGVPVINIGDRNNPVNEDGINLAPYNKDLHDLKEGIRNDIDDKEAFHDNYTDKKSKNKQRKSSFFTYVLTAVVLFFAVSLVAWGISAGFDNIFDGINDTTPETEGYDTKEQHTEEGTEVSQPENGEDADTPAHPGGECGDSPCEVEETETTQTSRNPTAYGVGAALFGSILIGGMAVAGVAAYRGAGQSKEQLRGKTVDEINALTAEEALREDLHLKNAPSRPAAGAGRHGASAGHAARIEAERSRQDGNGGLGA